MAYNWLIVEGNCGSICKVGLYKLCKRAVWLIFQYSRLLVLIYKGTTLLI